jgi:hypothetical protein
MRGRLSSRSSRRSAITGGCFFRAVAESRQSEIISLCRLPHDFGSGRRGGGDPQIALPDICRENVYLQYKRGRWDVVKPQSPLVPSAAVGGAARPRHPRYLLRADTASVERRETWRVEILTPRLLGGFCLPGTGLALTCAGAVPLTETKRPRDGAGAVSGRL